MNSYERLNILILIATIAAIVIGPIAAVLITRASDSRAERRRSQGAVFAALMGTRATRLSADHVQALNRVQVEFYGKEKILGEYKKYIHHLGATFPDDPRHAAEFSARGYEYFIDLVHAMAKELGYELDKRDMQTLSYGPQGWVNDEEDIRALRSSVRAVFEGRAVLPVTFQAGPPPEGFPPAPGQEGK